MPERPRPVSPCPTGSEAPAATVGGTLSLSQRFRGFRVGSCRCILQVPLLLAGDGAWEVDSQGGGTGVAPGTSSASCMVASPPELDTLAAEINPPAGATPRPDAGSVAQSIFIVLARFAFGAWLLVTSAYCLLLYIPFTYFGFIQHPLLAWLPVFVRIHSYLFGILFATVAVTLLPAIRAPKTRRAAIGFLLIHAGVAVDLLFRPALPSMLRDLFAYVWSMLCLVSLLWVA